jgi:hypothetical protein
MTRCVYCGRQIAENDEAARTGNEFWHDHCWENWYLEKETYCAWRVDWRRWA